MESALILSPGPSGYTLTAREVMSVPLKADLVTLSACRSAGAKTYSGEGLVGLSWAFLRAGAGSVVAGLWDVTDGSTAKLMGDFYALMAKGSDPAEALRTAKLTLMRNKWRTLQQTVLLGAVSALCGADVVKQPLPGVSRKLQTLEGQSNNRSITVAAPKAASFPLRSRDSYGAVA